MIEPRLPAHRAARDRRCMNQHALVVDTGCRSCLGRARCARLTDYCSDITPAVDPITSRRVPTRSRAESPGHEYNSIIIDSMRTLLFMLALPAVYAQNGSADGATHAD